MPAPSTRADETDETIDESLVATPARRHRCRAALLAAPLACTAVALAGPPGLQPRMSDPLAGLTASQLDRFLAGRNDYLHTFSVEEGLGPIFNKESCGNCHNNPIGGTGSQTVTRFGATDKKGKGFDPLAWAGGPLLQSQAIEIGCEEVVPGFATVTTFRVTNGMLGYGLVEAIPDAALLANELSPPAPFISGRAHIAPVLENPGETRVGRFGWKAQLATVLSFSGDASGNEVGITNRLLPHEQEANGPGGKGAVIPCDTVADPEDGPDGEGMDFIDRITDFQRFLAAPPQTPKSGMTGETHFLAVGCGYCHTPSFVTADDPSLEDAIRNKTIRPYSDFLLHDMGINADFFPQGDAGEREMRTPPLWGLRVRDPLWHDGRFGGGTFEERVDLAIQAHGGFGSEGIQVVANFNALTPTEKTEFYRFLDSLGRREFDADGDGEVLMADFLSFMDCLAGGTSDPDDPCAVHDLDEDGVIDLSDFAGFIVAWDGAFTDCNENGILDLADIVYGTSLDTDGDWIPDECQAAPCPGDLTGSGDVGLSDLLQLLANWGPCPGCPADLDGTDEVDFNDLLLLLTYWGPCP